MSYERLNLQDSNVFTAKDLQHIEDALETHANALDNIQYPQPSITIEGLQWVDNRSQMTNTSIPYVMLDTGHIYAFANATTSNTYIIDIEQEKYQQDIRFGSDGSVSSVSGVVTIGKIDISNYALPFSIHLKGVKEWTTDNSRVTAFKASGTMLSQVKNCPLDSLKKIMTCSDINYEQKDDGDEVVFKFTTTPVWNYGTTSEEYTNLMFSYDYIDFNNVKCWISYQVTETGPHWIDTGMVYAPTVSESDKTEIIDEIINTIDSQMLNIIGDGVMTE